VDDAEWTDELEHPFHLGGRARETGAVTSAREWNSEWDERCERYREWYREWYSREWYGGEWHCRESDDHCSDVDRRNASGQCEKWCVEVGERE